MAKVVIVPGGALVKRTKGNREMSFEEAQADAAVRNGRAARLGIQTRYEAIGKAPTAKAA